MNRLLLALPLVLCGPSPAFAYSGFLQEELSAYVKVSFDSLMSSDLYSTSGERLDASGAFTQNNLSLYAELGLHENLTVGLAGAVLRMNSFDTSDVATGFGDLQLFAKLGAELAGFHGAFIAAVELPTGQSEYLVDTEFEGIRTNLPTGDGETNVWLRLALSRPIPLPAGWSAYASIHGGVNVRTAYAEQLATGFELGVAPLPWLWIQGRMEALFTPTAVEDLDPTGIFLFGEGTEYVAAGASVNLRIPSTPLWVTADYRNTFANLKNLYAGSTFGFGLAADF